MVKIARLEERGVVEVSGDDRVSFLQGLVSNDVAEAVPGRAVWAALLSPQGKYLADFFVFSDGARLLLDCERQQAAGLVQRLRRFRLRAKVELRDVSAEFAVYAAWEGTPEVAGIAAPDPRRPEAGWRILATGTLTANASAADWDRHRLILGLPDGTRDLEVEKSILLEAGFDELNGVSWTKGCYMGQELTARTKYRGLIKRRLLPVRVEGALPAPGTPVMSGPGEVGVMRSGRGDRGLANLRIEAAENRLVAGEAELTAEVPAWMNWPVKAAG